jgi:hypothetical protein
MIYFVVVVVRDFDCIGVLSPTEVPYTESRLRTLEKLCAVMGQSTSGESSWDDAWQCS